MKLIRFGDSGREKPGVVDGEGVWRDLSGEVDDWAGPAIAHSALARVRALDLSRFPVVNPATRLGPCVGGGRKVVCIGLNYADHAAETGAKVPEEPVIFLKACAPTGADDDIPLPRGSTKMDWEVELGVVIGERCVYASEDEALHYVAGYCVANDLSERAWQMEGTGTWDKGKGADGFAPIGPWLVTRDEIPDPHRLAIWLEVNGERLQDSSTDQMVNRIPRLVSYVSRFMSLAPGDVIMTGTPPGVGLGMRPPLYLKAGDSLRLGIEGLGEQRSRIVDSA